MSWYKLRFSFAESSDTDAFLVTDLVRRRDDELNHPSGVAVFSGIAPGEDVATTYNEVYFSPAAESMCSDILAEWGAVECPAPLAGELQAFGLS